MKLDPKLIDPNPYQPRVELGDLSELVASLKAHGLQQKPSVRAVGKRYQLQFGHRRHAAWQVAFPGQPIEAEVTGATDQQMFEAAIVENEHRQGINPIERAQAMKRYIDEFKVSQADAGTLFGLASQGAVSNAMRLLKLPAKAQGLVATGEIAERDIRRLLPLLKLPEGPKLTQNIVEHAAKSEASERGDIISGQLDRALRQYAMDFRRDTWDYAWPKEPITLMPSEWTKGTPTEIPACKGCPFFIRHDGNDHCLRPACFKAKTVLWMRADAEAAAKKLGIPMAADGEKVKVIFTGDHTNEDLCRRALKLKDRAIYLRIVMADDRGYSWNRGPVLGSEYAALATVDEAGLRKALPKETKEEKTRGRNDAYNRQATARRKRAEEVKQIAIRAGTALAPILPDNKELLELLAYPLTGASLGLSHAAAEKKFQETPVAQRRELVMQWLMLHRIDHFEYSNQATPARALTTIYGLATKLKVKLPRHWNVPPTKPMPALATNGKAKPKGKKK